MAESLWEPDLEAEDLFETISQTLLNAVDRDAYSGWGAVVWVIEKVRLGIRRFVASANADSPIVAHTGQGHQALVEVPHGLIEVCATDLEEL